MTNKKKNVSLRGRQRDILYPILIECSDISKEDFWRQFYEDLAYGKACKGIYITNGVIHTSNKRNVFVYSISDKDPEVIIKELHVLLLNHTGICSKKDMNKKKQIIKDIDDEFCEYDNCKWTSIKRKNIRDTLIINYAIFLKRKHKLNWKSSVDAHKTIVKAFLSKTHSSKDVVYEKGKIINIEGIEYIDGEMINTRKDKDLTNLTENQDNNNSSIMLQSLFEPYVTECIKKC